MGRPRRHSDEAMLDAALAVLNRVGPNRFTLSSAADEIGMTRPALIQRFGRREDLIRALSTRQVALTRTWLDQMPVERSEPGLRSCLAAMVTAISTGEGFAAHIALAALESEDPALAAMARDRFALLRNAISARVPRGLRLRPREAAALLHAVIAGAILQWATERGRSLSGHVQARVDQTLLILLSSDPAHPTAEVRSP